MKSKKTKLQTRLYLISAAIILVGLVSSVWIYLAAGDDAETAMGYEIVGGNVYLVAPENSKDYVHDLKVMGGNAAVYADELNRWFFGLWHGKTLALTIACIAAVISLGFFLAAKTSPPDEESDGPDENNGMEK